jgi:aspartate carbamoyltransferase regulatory subunit
MNMKLGSRFLNSLRIKNQLLKRLQRVIVVDSATHSQKDVVEGNETALPHRQAQVARYCTW